MYKKVENEIEFKALQTKDGSVINIRKMQLKCSKRAKKETVKK